MNIEQKNNLMSNIEYLCKVKKIKKADLESKAGVSKGYLSRFKNDDPNNLPSISFIESVASQLYVSIDALINCELRDTSTLYNIELLKKLIHDTENKKLEWSIGDADIKMTGLKKSNKEDPYFMTQDISYEVTDEAAPCYNDEGFKEGYLNSDGEFRELFETDTVLEEHLVFKPGLTTHFELWTDQCCQPFVDGCYYWTELDSNTKLFFLNMATFEEGQALDDEAWQQLTLWIVGEDTDLLLEEGIESAGVKNMLSDLEDTIIRSKNSISKSNRIVLDRYLKN